MNTQNPTASPSELVPSTTGNPIKSIPDDLAEIIREKKGFGADIKTVIVSPFDIDDFIQQIKIGALLPLPMNQVLSISDALGKNNPHPSHLFPVMRDGFLIFILLYSYPNYRFMDWVSSDVNIRLSHHVCIAGSK